MMWAIQRGSPFDQSCQRSQRIDVELSARITSGMCVGSSEWWRNHSPNLT